MVDVTPGDSGANKGFWRQQVRDRYGKFVEMGGAVLFEVELEGVQGVQHATGFFIGMLDLETARIEVRDNKKIPKGVYFIKTDKITAVEAVLPRDYVEETLNPTAPEAPELKSSMSGDEALKIRMKSIARALKEKGRFPMPRVSFTTTRGKTSDVTLGARADFQKVFDSSPEVQDRFKNFESLWQYVSKAGADEQTQSPNQLSEIPEEMKLLNREYAKHVLGLDPNGTITFYRNAINGKDTEEESAVGYLSLDKDMAYDYGALRENIRANGRYEVDVKPDEVYGLLGYSQIEDEYGVTIGREVANIPGRVRRVGDLKPVETPSWVSEYADEFNRGKGQSAFRNFGLAAHYDFHEVENFLPDTIQDFFQKYNIQASDIAAKFDELYGEDSYAEYKASGNSVSYQEIQKMFVKLDNGNLGLNVKYVDGFNIAKDVESFKNDALDNRLKMLSLFQELTGQYFMTHKTRGYEPPEPETMYEDFFEAGNIDLASLRNSADRIGKYDREMFTDEQLKALEQYGQSGYREVNKLLRENTARTPEQEDLIKLIDEAIEENGDLFSAGRVFRGDLPASGSEYEKFLMSLEQGKTFTFPGYFSTSNDAQLAFSEFGPGIGSGDEDGSAAHLGPAFFWTIDVPENGKAMAMPDDVGYGQGAESEVLLPRNSNFKVLGVKKVQQIDDDGEYTGNYNYFIHAEQLDTSVQELPDSPQAVEYKSLDFNDVPEFKYENSKEEEALLYYTGDPTSNVQEVGHVRINQLLRENKLAPNTTREQREELLERMEALRKLVNSTELDADTKVVRWQRSLIEGLDRVGAVWQSDGFLSTSTETKDGQEVYNAFTNSPVLIEINLPKGTRGGAVPGSVEAEILLPPGSRFVVDSVETVDKIKKVTITLVGQMDKNERFNDEAFREATDPQLVEEVENDDDL